MLCHHPTAKDTSSQWLDMPKEVLVARIEARTRLGLQARQSNTSAAPTSARRSMLRELSEPDGSIIPYGALAIAESAISYPDGVKVSTISQMYLGSMLRFTHDAPPPPSLPRSERGLAVGEVC
jgi:hypothetical protein